MSETTPEATPALAERSQGGASVPYERFKVVNDEKVALEASATNLGSELEALKKAHAEEIARLTASANQIGNELESSRKDVEARALALTRVRVAVANGLPLELADRLQGADEATLTSDALRVAAYLKPVSPGAPPPLPPSAPLAPLDPSHMSPEEIRKSSATILSQARGR